MRASKPLAIAAALAALSAVSWAGVGQVAASRIEGGLARGYADLAALPFVTVKAHRHDRGAGGATDQVTFAIGCAAAQRAGGTGPQAGFEVSLRHRIAHGPYVGGTFAAARIETELVLSDEATRRLGSLFGGRAPFTAVTTVAFDGALETTVDVPPLRVDAATVEALGAGSAGGQPPAGTIAWEGLRLVARLSGDRERSTYRAALGPLRMDLPAGGRLETSVATVEGQGRRVAGGLYDDDSRFEMASVAIDLPAAPGDGSTLAGPGAATPLAMKDLRGTSVLRLDGEYLGQQQTLAIGSLDYAGDRIGTIHYDTSVGRIHQPTLSAAVQAIGASLARDCAASSGASAGDRGVDARVEPPGGATLGLLKQASFDLLRHEPYVGVDRLSLTLPEGEARLGYRFAPGPITEAELAHPQAWMSRVGLKVDASIGEPLIVRLLGLLQARAGGEAGATAEQLTQAIAEATAPMVAQGYLNRSGGTLSSTLELKAGRVTVNGRPLDEPVAALALGAIAQAAAGIGGASDDAAGEAAGEADEADDADEGGASGDGRPRAGPVLGKAPLLVPGAEADEADGSEVADDAAPDAVAVAAAPLPAGAR